MTQIVKNGVDWSAGWATGPQIIESGNEFACRYMSYDWRGLRDEEVTSFRSSNVGIVPIAEYDTIDENGEQVSAMLGGGAQGHAHAEYADDIRKARGLHDLVPLQFTLDVAPGVVPWNLVADYLRGAAGYLGGVHRMGLYSGIDGIDFAYKNGLADWLWQTYAWSYDADGNPRLHPNAVLYQYDIYGEYVSGVNVDLNKAFAENYGQTQASEAGFQSSEFVKALHPDWFSASLSVRYPSVGRWKWNDQTLVLDTIRHNALTTRKTWQYAGPSTGSGHAGKELVAGVKVNVERITDVEEVHAGKNVIRTWVLQGNGTWIPEDALDLDFTISRRKKR